MPQVSVIIPTYNRATLIPETLQSVFNQTVTDYEIIVVDDGSTDNTLDVLASYGNKLIVLNEPNRGMGGSYARTAGVKKASGKYIAFLDSDDLWLPTKLEKQLAVLEKQPHIGWCYTDVIAFDTVTKQQVYQQSRRFTLKEGNILEPLFIQNFIPFITILVRQTVMHQVGDFWPTPKGTDADMMLRLAHAAPVAYIPEVLAHYRLHPVRVTDKILGSEAFTAGEQIINRAAQRSPQQLTPLKHIALARISLAAALTSLKHGQNKEARQLFAKAITYHPRSLALYWYWLSTFLPHHWLLFLNTLRSK